MTSNSKFTTMDMTFIALATALIVICSWITIPFVEIPFTLQTLGITTTAAVLGKRNGTISVLLYILLGAVGIPVFAQFKSGLTAILGPTGGYIIGFIFTALIVGYLSEKFDNKILYTFISMILGVLVCYVFGTAWFIKVYSSSQGPISLMTALSWCIFPFIIPDLIKISVSALMVNNLKKNKHLKF